LLVIDGQCNGGGFNTELCGWDGGDCEALNTEYPECELLKTDEIYKPPRENQGIKSDWPALSDGKCNGGIFNNETCGFDGGDCVACNAAVPDPSKIGKFDV
jgi:hypothetical protein